MAVKKVHLNEATVTDGSFYKVCGNTNYSWEDGRGSPVPPPPHFYRPRPLVSLGPTLGVFKQQSPSPRWAGSTSGFSPTPPFPFPVSAVGSSCCSSPCPVGRMALGRYGHSIESRRVPSPSKVPRKFIPSGGRWGRPGFQFRLRSPLPRITRVVRLRPFRPPPCS